MAMVNYPYETSFLVPLPAWPVSYACDQAKQASEAHAEDLFVSLMATAAAADVYYNYEGTTECIDPYASYSSGISQDGWNVLYCNEIA